MPNCYSCDKEIDDSNYGRQDSCKECNNPTRVCYNCTHYDSSKYNECTEPVAERVVDKDKSNFCDYFKPGNPDGRPGGQSKKDALAAANALFKK